MNSPANGLVDVHTYQLFMRNVSQGKNTFILFSNYSASEFSGFVAITDMPSGKIFEFFYRGVNKLGAGGNSSISRIATVDVPQTPSVGAIMSISGKNVIIDWTVVDASKIKYYVVLNKIQYWEDYYEYQDLSILCNGTLPMVIKNT